MKKNYETPEAKKLEFNYTDAVTASGTTEIADPEPGPSNSGYSRERYYTSPQAGSPPPCSFQWRYVSNC